MRPLTRRGGFFRTRCHVSRFRIQMPFSDAPMLPPTSSGKMSGSGSPGDQHFARRRTARRRWRRPAVPC